MNKSLQFTRDRDWDQFHNGKDLALALSIEAAELNEAFYGKKPKMSVLKSKKEELADIMNYAFLIADKYQLDIKDIILSSWPKMQKKYPLTNLKEMQKKYTEL